ncbi:metal-sensing transcriptional repressor [Acidisphaera sp. L21]
MRGLIAMLEADRYCLNEVQQANAVTSVIRAALNRSIK